MDDPTEKSHWRPLYELLARLDADVARIYTDRRIDGLKPTYVRELLQLHYKGPLTITELAEVTGRTHSALSQKVAGMRTAGLVRTVPGADARSKRVTLTAKSKKLVELLAAEWSATDAALAELDAELPYPLTQVVRDVEAALERQSFHDRITAKLAGVAGLEDAAKLDGAAEAEGAAKSDGAAEAGGIAKVEGVGE
ncbi:MarR family transcriptional regulator [Kribbella solani]|uniref:MarR family winged helix-turn-helix transcriptional regulator n=1 Tax=Kribbella solani TaxID=236067 RepID=UPI0029ACB37D|nr:MarR family transcriptional regulator [Kribbella solani]MDX3005496.1 MarR family transcriptional regulator [Kribbella solani]